MENIFIIFLDDIVSSGFYFNFYQIDLYDKSNTDILEIIMHAFTTIYKVYYKDEWHYAAIVDYLTNEGQEMFALILTLYPNKFNIYGGSDLNFAIACQISIEKILF